jgi:trimeric autotransporter adhesin
MMNVYNGNVTTDRHGQATVNLPDYFEALNGDFRYQLTVIGQFAQAIVAKKIAANRLVIRTSKPNVEVSWQVTGIRHDAYANVYRIPVEEDKAVGEQGYDLHPEVFGQPESKGISAA